MSEKKPNVTGYILFGIAELLTRQEIDPYRFYQQFGLSTEVEDNQDSLIPFSTFIEMLNALKAHLNCNHPGINLARFQHENQQNSYFDLAASAPNIEAALQLGYQYRHVASEVSYWDWTYDDKYLFIKRVSFVPLSMSDKEHTIYLLSHGIGTLDKVVGNIEKYLEYVSFIHAEDNSRKELSTYFGRPIRFGQEFDGFVLKKAALYQPSPNFDAKRYQLLLKQVISHKSLFPHNQRFSALVKYLITKTLSTGGSDIANIAETLDIHHRTLQNRLKKEGLTFKDLLSDIRQNMATRLLLHRDLPLQQISEMLGYSEPSAFTRAFKQAHRVSPRAWRNNIQ